MEIITRLFTACALAGSLATAAQPTPPPQPPAPAQFYNPAWSPDGTRLMYEMSSGGRTALFTVRANGAANRPLSNFRGNHSNGSWSPDGTRVAFVSDTGGQLDVYVAGVDLSAPTNVSNDPGQQYQPAWSHDGRFIAYVTKPAPADRLHDIVVFDVATGARRVIALPDTNELAPSFSPDGTRLVFSSNRTGRNEIYTMALDGSDVKALTRDSGSSMPRWSRDGRIAFRSDREGNGDIYLMNADGSGVTRFTNTPADEAMPAWSPDGTRLAYVATEDGRRRIMAAAIAGGAAICVEGACGKAHEAMPSFSPDGRQIVFVKHRGDARASDLHIVGIDGAGMRQLTTSDIPKSNPSWSPDGRAIVFSSRQAMATSLWIVDVATGAETRLSAEAGDQTPAFSPDGSDVVFASGAPGNINLQIMKRDGTARRPLTSVPSPTLNFWPSWANDRIVFSTVRNPGPGMTMTLAAIAPAGGQPEPIMTQAAGPQCASLSRDARRIAFQGRSESDNTDIFVINIDGTSERRLTADPALDEAPAWSPDGSAIAFQSDRSGEMRVYIMNADGTNVRRLTR